MKINWRKIIKIKMPRKEDRPVSVWKIATVFVCIAVAIGIVIFCCYRCGGDDKYDFKSSDHALDVYQQYLEKVRTVKFTNTKDFCSLVAEWKETNDTVYHFILKENAHQSSDIPMFRFETIHEAVLNEMLRLTETWRYGYSDVLELKEKTSSFKEDKELQKAVKEAEPFFSSLNNASVVDTRKEDVLRNYRAFLSTARRNGFKSKEDMLRFIKLEDYIFRTFLSHLHEMDNEPLSDITQTTGLICQDIFMAAREGRISAKDAIVYMSMRTVRRLLQNSVACVDDIGIHGIKSRTQGNAYLWMILQPFVSIDQFSLATMTQTERDQFNHIISQLSKSRRFAKTFGIEVKSLNYLLPQQLMKIYVLSL